MSTVAGVINRLYRTYLTPPSRQWSRCRLNEALDTSETDVTINVADGFLTPEELNLLGEGTVIEVDRELMSVTDWTTPTLTVVRGEMDTTAATHADAATVYIAPEFTRQAVFDAVCDATVDLYPDLYAVKTDAIVTSDTAVEVDETAVELHKIQFEDGTNWIRGSAELLTDMPAVSSTVAVKFNPGIAAGLPGYVTYFAKFSRPTAETDDLTSTTGTWRIDGAWEKIIMIDALATLVGSTPMEKVTLDFISEILRAQGYPIRDAISLQSALLKVRENWLERAKTRLRVQYPITTSLNRTVY